MKQEIKLTPNGVDPNHEVSDVLSDRSLLRRMKVGNQEAATAMYLRYAGRLQALAQAKSSPDLARRVDSQEIAQSVFGSFLRGIKKGYYDIPEGQELWNLFMVIALNKIRSKAAYFSAAKRDVRRTSGSNTLELDSRSVSDDSVPLKILELSIEESLANMPAHYRSMIELRISGCTVDEIAQQTNRSKRSVERILQEIRVRLKQLKEVD